MLTLGGGAGTARIDPNSLVKVKLIEQESFESAAFDQLRFNLHTSLTGPRRRLAIFVHGFGGSGYCTWAGFPAMMFDGFACEPADVAIFDYPSGLRALSKGGARLRAHSRRLAAGILELSGFYESIHFFCHSLGGLVGQRAVIDFLIDSSSSHAAKPNSTVAAIYAFACPRAGTGLAHPVLSPFVREFRWLGRFSDECEEIERYFSNHVESRNIGGTVGQTYLIPRYVCRGAADGVVNSFSAAFGIPSSQIEDLAGDHTDIAKPTDSDFPQVRWACKSMAEIESNRDQWIRQTNHDANFRPQKADSSHVYTAQIHNYTADSVWDRAYNVARQMALRSGITVHDSDEPTASSDQLDLMVAVHDSNKVLSGASQAGDDSSSTLVQQAHNRQNEHRRLIVGFAPVGINHEPAAEVIRSWLDTGLEPLSRTFVEGAQAPDGFIKVVLRWILLLVGRDPTKPPPAPLPTNDRSQLLPTSVDEYFGDLR